MAKGQPFSIRLEEETETLVEAEARRTRRSKSAVVEALAEESACARRYPGIAFRGDDARRRAWVIGSSLDVWEIAQIADDFGSTNKLLAETQLTATQVRLALAYRDACAAEVDELLGRSRSPPRRLHPHLDRRPSPVRPDPARRLPAPR